MTWTDALAKFFTDPSNMKDVVLPFVAILVSAAIAVGLANFERVASRKDRRNAAIADYGQAINVLGYAATSGDGTSLTAALFAFDAAGVKLRLSLPTKERDVVGFFDIVIFSVHQIQDRRKLIEVTGWLSDCLIAFAEGTVAPTGFIQIARSRGTVPTVPVLSEWEQRIAAAVPAASSEKSD